MLFDVVVVVVAAAAVAAAAAAAATATNRVLHNKCIYSNFDYDYEY